MLWFYLMSMKKQPSLLIGHWLVIWYTFRRWWFIRLLLRFNFGQIILASDCSTEVTIWSQKFKATWRAKNRFLATMAKDKFCPLFNMTLTYRTVHAFFTSIVNIKKTQPMLLQIFQSPFRAFIDVSLWKTVCAL